MQPMFDQIKDVPVVEWIMGEWMIVDE